MANINLVNLNMVKISAGHRKFFFKSAVRKSTTEFQFS